MSGITTSTIKSVEKQEEGYFITKSDGWGFGLRSCGVEPQVGDKISVHENGRLEVLDVFLNDVLVFHQTEEDLERKKEQYLKEVRENIKADYEKNKTLWERQIEALAVPLRERMKRLISQAGGSEQYFLEHMGSYELFICMEAEKAVEVLRPVVEGIESYELARATVFDNIDSIKELGEVMSKDHSGNTWGASIQLALAVIYGIEV